MRFGLISKIVLICLNFYNLMFRVFSTGGGKMNDKNQQPGSSQLSGHQAAPGSHQPSPGYPPGYYIATPTGKLRWIAQFNRSTNSVVQQESSLKSISLLLPTFKVYKISGIVINFKDNLRISFIILLKLCSLEPWTDIERFYSI